MLEPTTAPTSPSPPALPGGWDFHHLGYACKDLDAAQRFFAAIGYTLEGAEFEDPTQGIRGRFLNGAGPRIELLQDLPGRDTLRPWLDGGGSRLYHLAYEVPDMDAALAWSRAQRGLVTVQPVAAVAFGGRRIAFVMFRHGPMLEFIERG
ncbi:VOC family protein [Pelomonas sp. CA6]|uniref:VOC family protein n=1 Tax=Pelomonas sp. CA6 TaxID=2907999 RepID=UPI001F4C2859|nr:VOC family protein [Pelomonas sp. CA6]MCH7344984.1 VOC family protein [Pelomonas sp. CA6]